MSKSKNEVPATEKTEVAASGDQTNVVVVAPALELERLTKALGEAGFLTDGESVVDKVIVLVCGSADRERTLRERIGVLEIQAGRQKDIIEMLDAAKAALEIEVANLRGRESDLVGQFDHAKIVLTNVAAERDRLNELVEALASPEMPDGRVLREGTKLGFAGEVVTLRSTAVVEYPLHESEQKFVGLLLADPENFDANKRDLSLLYNRTNGALLPAADQKPEALAQATDAQKRLLGIAGD